MFLCVGVSANANNNDSIPNGGMANGSMTNGEIADGRMSNEGISKDSISEPDRLAEDFVSMSLIVAEPGDVLYSIMGHACLHAQCPYYDIDYIYTYESEDVRGKVARFLMNNLKMGMMYMPLDYYLEPYKQEGRGVKEYALNLPAEVKTELWRVLDEKVAEGIELEYDYITRGCAISIVHCLKEAIDKANALHGEKVYSLCYPTWDKRFDRTLREIVYDNSPAGWQRFYGMTIVGGKVDATNLRKADKLIIPRELVDVWQQTTINGTTIISAEPSVLLEAEKDYSRDSHAPLWVAIVVLVLAIANCVYEWLQKSPREIGRHGKTLRVLSTIFTYCMLTLLTLLGILEIWLLLSPLPGSEWSWLLIPFNPLPAIFWKWRNKWGIYYLALVVIWSIAMLAAPHRLVEYTHIVLALACALVCAQAWLRKQEEKLRATK